MSDGLSPYHYQYRADTDQEPTTPCHPRRFSFVKTKIPEASVQIGVVETKEAASESGPLVRDKCNPRLPNPMSTPFNANVLAAIMCGHPQVIRVSLYECRLS